MIVSAMASFEGKNDMAVGNAVGSVTANTGLILAVAMLFMHVVCKRKEYMRQCILLAAAAVVLWLSCYTGSVSIWGSIALIAIFVISMVGNVRDAKKDMSSDKKESVDKKKFAFTCNKIPCRCGTYRYRFTVLNKQRKCNSRSFSVFPKELSP